MAKKRVENLKRFNFHMPMEVYEWLENKSARTGIPVTALILMAIEKVRSEGQVMESLPVVDRLLEAMRTAKAEE